MPLRLESRDCSDSMNVVWLPVQLSKLANGQSSPTALQFHTAHAKEIITINKCKSKNKSTKKKSVSSSFSLKQKLTD